MPFMCCYSVWRRSLSCAPFAASRLGLALLSAEPLADLPIVQEPRRGNLTWYSLGNAITILELWLG